jgi:hypothetical protein
VNAKGRKKAADEKRIFEAGRKALEIEKAAETAVTLANAHAKDTSERAARMEIELREANVQCRTALETAKAAEAEATETRARARVLDGVVIEVMRLLGQEGKPLKMLISTLTMLLAELAALRHDGAELAAQCCILDKELNEARSRLVSAEGNEKLRKKIVEIARERDEALAKLAALSTSPRTEASRPIGMIASLEAALAASGEKVD